MDSATVFAIGIGTFAAMELVERAAVGLHRLAGRVPWLAARAGRGLDRGQRDDFYVFYQMRDLTGDLPPARPAGPPPVRPVRRPSGPARPRPNREV